MKQGLPGTESRVGVLDKVFADVPQTCEPNVEKVTLYAEFSVTGLARCLSHADLLRTLMRSCVRADIGLHYSQGFNPHPRLSLPIPKAVGLTSAGDVLCFQIRPETCGVDLNSVRTRLMCHFPKGIRLIKLYVSQRKLSLLPAGAEIHMMFPKEKVPAHVAQRIKDVLAESDIWVQRHRPGKRNKTKHINIRPFIQTMSLTLNELRVTININAHGSVRVDELLTLLELTTDHLLGPICRDNIVWRVAS